MTPKDQFVLDFFQLGVKAWLEKYSGNVPELMNAHDFANEIEIKKLQQDFIDKPSWSESPSTNLPCYLVPSKRAETYDVIAIIRGYPEERAKEVSLKTAIFSKTEILFDFLRIGYVQRQLSNYDQIILDYFKLTTDAWFKKYRGNLPDGMLEDFWLVKRIKIMGLLDYFIDESWRTNKSDTLCTILKPKNNLYDVLLTENGTTTILDSNLELDYAVQLKGKTLISKIIEGYSTTKIEIHEQFFLDYFNLGYFEWDKKYRGNIPTGMNEYIFSREIHARGLEIRMVDKPIDPEKYDPRTSLPCNLVKSEENPHRYEIQKFGERGGIDVIKSNLSLEEAIAYKVNLLFWCLGIGYWQARDIIFDKFIIDYFKLGAEAWIKNYYGKIPNMTTEFISGIKSMELEQDFIEEHSWRADPSAIPCYISVSKQDPQKYDVFYQENNVVEMKGSALSLEDALDLKVEILFSKLEEGYRLAVGFPLNKPVKETGSRVLKFIRNLLK